MKQKENHKQSDDYRVVYDMQTNEYIKIHKQLGTEIKVHKDGSELKKFYPQLTGQFSSSKRFKQDPLHHRQSLHTQLSTMSNSKTLGVFDNRFVVRKRPQNSKFKTIELQPKAYRPFQSEHHTAATAELFPSITRKDFFKQLISARERSLEPQTKTLDPFSETLKRFNELRADSIYENHSLKKDIPGSSPRVSPERIHLANKPYFQALTSQHFRPEQRKHADSLKSSPRTEHFPEGYQRMQFLKQRELYLKAHPERKSPERALNLDELRRKNLIRLQKQTIQHNSKATSKVYGK